MERDDKSLDKKNYIETATMAEIYIQAKRYQDALEIYRRILSRDPSNPEIARRVEELENNLKSEYNQ